MKDKLSISGLLIFAFLLAACRAQSTSSIDTPRTIVTEAPQVDETEAPTEAPTKSAVPTATAEEPGPTSSDITVAVTQADGFGSYLADVNGMSLYVFKNDPVDVSSCYGSCANNWPPLLTEADPVAGIGVDSNLLGTIERDDGTTQVTYNGHPLYYFKSDTKRGDVKGQGIQNVWYIFSPAGEMITAAEGVNDSNYDYNY